MHELNEVRWGRANFISVSHPLSSPKPPGGQKKLAAFKPRCLAKVATSARTRPASLSTR